jgi:nicotinate-nucleotide pyrophosphorylase (carboxylating)
MTAAELECLDRLIDSALREDLGNRGDVTSAAFIPEALEGRAAFVARTPGILAGLPAAERVAARVSPLLKFEPLKQDGDALAKGDRIALLSGPMRAVLTGERTALNFMQRLSGVASLTRKYVDAVAGLPAQVLDTRKTTPGWRLLEKYAVRMGGGTNHRIGLYDAILVKDNHLAAVREAGGGWDVIHSRLEAARTAYPGITIEIEVDSFEQFEQALICRPDIILLDNMSPELMRRCVERRNRDAASSGVRLEASGGVNLSTIRGIAETGVDRISVGALTHSAAALDIALDYLD